MSGHPMHSPTPFISYAQHGEDVILWRALGDRPAGFYVDVGAFDPSMHSVTRALYERGWRGINIEPQPDRLEAFMRERPEDTNLPLAIADYDGRATLTVPDVAGWASILGPPATGADPTHAHVLDVPVRRLDHLLAELGVEHVDILKIDVEGAEPAVVRGLLAGPVRPVVCVVEGVAPGIGRAAGDEAVALLVSAGYLHCLFDGLNHYLTTDTSLEAALSLPANPIDEYLPAALDRLLRENYDLQTQVSALIAENHTLRGIPATPAGSAPTSVGVASVTRGAPEPQSAADPALRALRRRTTFRVLLSGESVATATVPPSVPGTASRVLGLLRRLPRPVRRLGRPLLPLARRALQVVRRWRARTASEDR